MKTHLERILIGGGIALASVLVILTTAGAQPAPAAPAPPAQPVEQQIDVEKAKKLYRDQGCLDCHKMKGMSGGGIAGPELSEIGKTRNLDYITRYIREPKSINPNTIMPAYGARLKDEELRLLSRWLASLK